MKRLLLFIFLLYGTVEAQMTVVPFTPTVSTTEIDSIVVTSGSATVYSVTKPFANVTAGMHVAGLRFPVGTTVVSNTNDSILVLSNKATSTVALDSMRVGLFTSLQYTAGDALGFAFIVPSNIHKLYNVIVEDDSKQITAVKLVFFSQNFTETEDNIPFAPSDGDAAKICGYLSLAVAETYTNNTIMTAAATTVPIGLPARTTYCQLECVGTPTFTAVNNLHITFVGE